MTTKLTNKQYSPMIIRKYQMLGWPMYIGIIYDGSLDDLDYLMSNIMNEIKKENNKFIEFYRQTCGKINDLIVTYYNDKLSYSIEGVAVLWYVDKMAVSSLYGDFMNHTMCRSEFYSILNMMPHL